MKTDKKKVKKKSNEKKYLVSQYIGNLIGVIFVAPGLARLTFLNFGNGAGDLFAVQAFVMLDIFCFMTIQCWVAVANTRKDYLRGKWAMESEPPAGAEDKFIINPWRIVLPPALIAGAITAAVIALIVPMIGQEPFHFRKVGLMAGIPLFVVSSIIISFLLPRDQAAFTAALGRIKMSAAPFRRYLIVEHILPWAFLQGIINLGIGLKQFSNEAAKHGGEVPVSVVATDFGIVSAIIVFFMWLSSMNQVRPDVQLGRVAEDGRKAPSVPGMLLIILSFLGIGAIVYGGLTLAGISTVPPIHAAIAKAFLAMVMVIPGCSLGIWWGTRRETVLMQGAEQSYGEAKGEE
jgi:hypothetical protein